MACFIFGAGEFYGLPCGIGAEDMVIAADGGWNVCKALGLDPDLLVGDFDSLGETPDFPRILRLPVEKDDTDMLRAVREGFLRGQREFHLLGGMGGRTDHTIANLQTLAFIAKRGGRGWLYGSGEWFTAVENGAITLEKREKGTFSVFCLGGDASGVTIRGGQYALSDAVLTADFPLGVSNHFTGEDVIISVQQGCLLIGINEKE